MILKDLKFRHFGLAVKSPEGAKRFLVALGYRIGTDVEDDNQRVFVCEADHTTHPRVEIIWPARQPSPIDRILKKGNGLIYHTCWETEDLPSFLEAMENSGVKVQLVSGPTPAPLFLGAPVSFFYVQGFGLIEILETNKG